MTVSYLLFILTISIYYRGVGWMGKTLKLNFTMPEDVARDLKIQNSKRKRSYFVAEAVRIRMEELKKEQLREKLIEGYQVRSQEDAETNKEWESATLEKWD